MVDPEYVLIAENVVFPETSTFTEPVLEITPLAEPPATFNDDASRIDTFTSPMLFTVVIPPLTFKEPEIAFSTEAIPKVLSVPPDNVCTDPPLESVSSPEKMFSICAESAMLSVPVLKLEAFTFPVIVPVEVMVPIIASAPSSCENLVFPVPDKDSRDTVEPLKVRGVSPVALFATTPSVMFPLNTAVPVPLRVNAFPLNNALDVKAPPVPTLIAPVSPDTVAEPRVRLPPTSTFPAPERVPEKDPPFSVSVLPEAIEMDPPFKLATVASAFALNVPSVSVLIEVVPFAVRDDVAPVNVVTVFPVPLSVTVPPLTFPSVA
jgi:hypothetical protein